MEGTWDPDTYRRYALERDRPLRDLLDRVDAAPRTVADLGCGDGRGTRIILDRWPEAEVVGVDASKEMLQEAHTDTPRLRFELADLRTWRPGRTPDLIVSNAALHWVPDHLPLLDRFLGSLSPEGVLAVQVPLNQEAPSHRAIRDLAQGPEWADRFEGIAPPHVLGPDVYLDHLLGRGCRVDLWTTTYHHLLPPHQGVLDWLRGTTLRPYLDRLGPDAEERFLEALGRRLMDLYPVRHGAVPYPFRRLFFVVQKPGGRTEG